MALIKCHECGTEVSTEAKTCPKCGAKVKKPTSVALKVLLGFVAIVIVASMAGVGGPPSTSTTTAINEPTVKSWAYDESPDSMTGKPVTSARIESNNTHQLDFPYHGGTVGTVFLRKHPRHGKDVIFQVNTGQLICNVSDGCDILVRFDDAKPLHVHANEPADYDSTVLFLDGYKRLVNGIMRSKKMIVEVTFHQQGNRQFEFNTAGLKWE